MKNWCNCGFLIFFACFLIPDASYSQGENKIILEHADTLRSRKGVRELIGHVRVRRGQTVIWADKSLYNPKTGQVTLTGNVRMDEPDRQINAKRVRYNEISGDFEASQNVVMSIGDSLIVNCEVARYFEAQNQVEMYNNIVIHSLTDNALIYGNSGKWNRQDDVAIIDSEPVYKLPDNKGDPPDTLVIRSELLTFFHEQKAALFTGNVKLRQAEIEADADTLFHEPDSNRTRLSGNPVLRRESDEVSGDVVRLFLSDGSLQRMEVKGRAIAITEARPLDERQNFLSGEELTMEIINDSTRVIDVSGDAQAQYHFWDKDDKYHGVNLVVADRIVIKVVSDRTEEINLSGRSNGTFYPDGMQPRNSDLTTIATQRNIRTDR